LLRIGTFSEEDIVVQMARCSFDMHMQDIAGTLISGAALVMLHPQGNMDFAYLLREIVAKDITYIQTVPTYISALCQYLDTCVSSSHLKKVRSVVSGGEYPRNKTSRNMLFFIFLR
jgi:non-ribosomal peptide synthetase component F